MYKVQNFKIIKNFVINILIFLFLIDTITKLNPIFI